jgi:hypothetical protein
MPRDLPELRASHEDRDRVVDTLRTAGGDGRLTAGELDARVERALSARTQGELAALVADLSAATATKDVLAVRQTGGKWTRAGRWTAPDRIEVRTKLCRVTFDFTDAVITSRTVRIDATQQVGAAVLGGRIWVAGGLTDAQHATAKTEFYDPGLAVQIGDLAGRLHALARPSAGAVDPGMTGSRGLLPGSSSRTLRAGREVAGGGDGRARRFAARPGRSGDSHGRGPAGHLPPGPAP